MEKILENLFDLKKIPIRVIFALWLCTCVILFVPEEIILRLNLNDFLSEYGKFTGITFLVSSSILFVSLIVYFFKIIYRLINRIKTKNSIREELNDLNLHEKAVIREFYINSKEVLQLPINDETVAGLFRKRIIYRVSEVGITNFFGIFYNFALSDFAKNEITNRLIGLPEQITEEDKNRILNERPHWAK